MWLIILSVTISIIISKLVIYLSNKYNVFIDCHKSNKPQGFHEEATPRSGGIAIIVTLFLFLTLPFGLKILVPSIFAFVSGIFEDFHNRLSAKSRLILQILAALIAIWLTDAIIIYLGLNIYLPYWIGLFFTIFAIVGLMNAINIIDGFNGLASGVSLLIFISFAINSYYVGNIELLYINLIIIGSILGFFVFNFPKGKIFLGDGGAYLIGFLIAIVGIFLTNKYSNVSPWYVLAIAIYPVWEVLFSIIRKLSLGQSPLKPDRYHFHMLVYRVITKNNPLTALFVNLFIMPFIFYSTFNAHNSIANIVTITIFIEFYTLIYFYLYSKDKRDENI